MRRLKQFHRLLKCLIGFRRFKVNFPALFGYAQRASILSIVKGSEAKEYQAKYPRLSGELRFFLISPFEHDQMAEDEESVLLKGADKVKRN